MEPFLKTDEKIKSMSDLLLQWLPQVFMHSAEHREHVIGMMD